MRPAVRAALLVLLVVAAGRAHAQSRGPVEPAVPEKAGKELHAWFAGAAPPRIDGRLDDPAWEAAPAIDDFVQNEPDSMAAPTERTVVQVAYDARTLYVAVRCFMNDPAQITDALGRRDTFPRSDIIRLSFDPRHDHLTAVVFHTNPSGVQNDDMWYDDTFQSADYNAVWDVQTETTEEGWTAEFAIPFSQFRFPSPNGPAVWGFNVRRDIVGRGEFDRWVPTPRGAQGFVSRFGHLVFDEPLATPRRVEFVPFTLARQQTGTHERPDRASSAGLDLRIGLGSSANLSATVNPDFGQVEQDPSVLNLSVFETFFPEKRPFFVEDSRVLVPPYGQFPMFHSRRIGQRPGRFALEAGDRVISRPDQTTILGAAKVTGRASTWTYGALTALTDREYARVEATGGDGAPFRTDRLIEPMTSYNVARVQHDVFGQSTIGAIATAVVRERDVDAYTGGVEYNLRWAQSHYNLNGNWVGTRAPFAGGPRGGFGGVTNFNYDSKHLAVSGHFDYFDPDFKNSDIGFLGTRPDKIEENWGVTYKWPDPTARSRNLSFWLNGDRWWTTDGLALEHTLGWGGEVLFLNFWDLWSEAGHQFQTMDDLDTRGGPPIVVPSAAFWNLGLGTDSRKPWQLWSNLNTRRTDAGGWNVRVGEELRLQPSPRTQTSLAASYTTGLDAAQWIRNTDADGDGVVDNVYGQLRRHVVSITGRATYAFTRDMTFEAYLQPFVAVGDYFDVRKLAAPGSYIFTPVALETDPDFSERSLLGNMVFRWEYRPGSALFVVWNMATADTSRPGAFSAFGDLGRAFTGDGEHVLMVKVNYWLGL